MHGIRKVSVLFGLIILFSSLELQSFAQADEKSPRKGTEATFGHRCGRACSRRRFARCSRNTAQIAMAPTKPKAGLNLAALQDEAEWAGKPQDLDEGAGECRGGADAARRPAPTGTGASGQPGEMDREPGRHGRLSERGRSRARRHPAVESGRVQQHDPRPGRRRLPPGRRLPLRRRRLRLRQHRRRADPARRS